MKTSLRFTAVIFALCSIFVPKEIRAAYQCIPKDYGFGSVVCVCNATFCGELDHISRLPVGQYMVLTSSKDGSRFRSEIKRLVPSKPSDISAEIMLTLYRNETFQAILGFGGALTDAAGINMNSISDGAKDKMLKSYFSTTGNEYNIIRVPIGGCDFSTRAYTYDDGHPDDFNLTHFALAPEDQKYKIPYIRAAQRMASRPLIMLASPWSAPAWMKTNGQLNGKGQLKGGPGGPYYNTWARYFVRFIEEYAKSNITFWGITAQNEPMDGNIVNFTFNCLGFSAELQRDFIALDLGPTLEKSGYGDIKILVLDDQRLMLPQWAQQVLSEASPATKYVSGIGFHWYLNFAVPPSVLTSTHEQFPDKFILATEACEGTQPWDEKHVMLGSWERGENYAHDIIQDLLHWTVGWIDWNLAVDLKGGPNWVNNFADSPIVVDAQNDQFYKQPMFYAIGHFSKFIKPGSVIINLTISESDTELSAVACEGPEKSTVVVLLNKSDSPRSIIIQELDGSSISAEIPPRSIQTYIWWM